MPVQDKTTIQWYMYTRMMQPGSYRRLHNYTMLNIYIYNTIVSNMVDRKFLLQYHLAGTWSDVDNNEMHLLNLKNNLLRWFDF